MMLSPAAKAEAGEEPGVGTPAACGGACGPGGVSQILQALVAEYSREQKEVAHLRASWMNLKAQNASLMAMVDDAGNARHDSNNFESSSTASVLSQEPANVPHPPAGKKELYLDGIKMVSNSELADEGDAAEDSSHSIGGALLPGQAEVVTPQQSIPARSEARAASKMSSCSLLSATFTKGLELRKEWRAHSGDPLLVQALTFQQTDSFEDFVEYKPRKTQGTVLQKFISNPTSQWQQAWGIIGGFLIMYDLLVIPLQVFEPAQHPILVGMDWITLLFWTLDMLCGPFRGYMRSGVAEMRPRKILDHYLYSGRWFMDAVTVVPDWIFTLMTLGSNNDPGNSVKLLRILRVTRTVRLMRLHRLKLVIVAINDMIDSEYINILVGIAKMLIILVLVNHYLACTWYAIAAYLVPDGETTWVAFHSFTDDHWFAIYATAFHWAITQFTPASMHVQPQNVVERCFTVALVIFALVGFSYIVGSISASLTKIRGMTEENAHEFWNIKRYLKHNNVPQTLRIRILRYGEHAVQLQKERVHIENNKVYQLISDQLRNELASAICTPYLSVHPLFEYLRSWQGATMYRLAREAVSYQYVGAAETVFHAGEIATNMYFVITGQMEYRKKIGGYSIEVVDSHEDWISEATLWVEVWKHLGVLNSRVECKLLLVSPAVFCRKVQLSPQAFDQIKHYAVSFIRWMEEEIVENLSDIGQGEDITDKLRTFVQSD